MMTITWDNMWETLGYISISCIIGCIFYALISTATATGNIEYCYIRQVGEADKVYTLVGSVDWRDDITMFSTKDYNEVVEKAKLINCSLNKSQLNAEQE